jgi:hypothetical protein
MVSVHRHLASLLISWQEYVIEEACSPHGGWEAKRKKEGARVPIDWELQGHTNDLISFY